MLACVSAEEAMRGVKRRMDWQDISEDGAYASAYAGAALKH